MWCPRWTKRVLHGRFGARHVGTPLRLSVTTWKEELDGMWMIGWMIGLVDDVRGAFVVIKFVYFTIVYDFIFITVLTHAAEHPIPNLALLFFWIDYLCIAFNMSKYLISLNIGLLDLHAPFWKVTKRACLGKGPDSYSTNIRHASTMSLPQQIRSIGRVPGSRDPFFRLDFFMFVLHQITLCVMGDGVCVCVQKD